MRWEYRRRVVAPWREARVLNQMGLEGWELCAVWWWWFYFKRPLP